MSRNIFPLITMAAIVAACMPKDVLRHEMRPLSQDGWRRQDTVAFDIDSTEAGARLMLCIRVDRTMPYDTLWLRLNADTVAIPVSEMKGGNLLQCEMLAGKVRAGRLNIIHLMRRAPLPGVREVGIKLMWENE